MISPKSDGPKVGGPNQVAGKSPHAYWIVRIIKKRIRKSSSASIVRGTGSAAIVVHGEGHLEDICRMQDSRRAAEVGPPQPLG